MEAAVHLNVAPTHSFLDPSGQLSLSSFLSSFSLRQTHRLALLEERFYGLACWVDRLEGKNILGSCSETPVKKIDVNRYISRLVTGKSTGFSSSSKAQGIPPVAPGEKNKGNSVAQGLENERKHLLLFTWQAVLFSKGDLCRSPMENFPRF